ncbi:SRPBCC family protein [Flavobacterium sp. N1719]|uniref:SRPBCC family protein n=1 Tax=Flavobacterium sp. N1719 TaxID=2885633 RepID=UPI002223AFFC|nr:SRPBCC domain-containing protein [Flavobacterium sp. N1719]
MASTIRVSEIYPVPPAEVWQALTDVHCMKFWYFNLKEFRAEPGFTFEFYGGKDENMQYLHRCTVLEVIPNKLLTYSWLYVGFKGISKVSFELTATAQGTLLQLTHSGISSFEQENKDFDCSEFQAGWNYILRISLKQYLTA